MVTVRTVNVAPVVAIRQRMHAHVIIRIKRDARNIVARVTNEHVVSGIDNEEVRRIGRICVIVFATHVTPVRITVNIGNWMRAVICNV